jgi:multidrug resistance efflux pump
MEQTTLPGHVSAEEARLLQLQMQQQQQQQLQQQLQQQQAKLQQQQAQLEQQAAASKKADTPQVSTGFRPRCVNRTSPILTDATYCLFDLASKSWNRLQRAFENWTWLLSKIG